MDTVSWYSRGVQISQEDRIIDFEQTNDVFFFADIYDEMQTMLNNISAAAARIGFNINAN